MRAVLVPPRSRKQAECWHEEATLVSVAHCQALLMCMNHLPSLGVINHYKINEGHIRVSCISH